MDLRQFPQNPKALLIEAKDKIIALEAQLAEANEKLDKYAGMCLPCPDMGMTLVVEQLKQEIAAANDKARLQRALDRIEAGESYFVSLNRNAGGWDCNACYRSKTCRGHSFESAVDAAEAAAQWAESQKEGEA
jgi:hypothetical protein